MELEAAIRAVRNGDAEAYATVVQCSERRLRAFLALQVPDRELVDEVAHLAYITAYEKLQTYELGTNFLAWIKRIALFHLRNECRRRHSHGGTPVEELTFLVAPGPAPGDNQELRDEVARLELCLKKLGPDARELIHMRYSEALEPIDIAERIGKAASHVRTILTRLRQSLATCMEAPHGS